MLMPFGKHRGWEIDELPDAYLRWLYSKADITSPELEDAIGDEYWKRFGQPNEEEEEPEPREVVVQVIVHVLPLTDRQRDVASKLIDAGYRQLAMKNHPDAGGDTRAMVAINEVVEILRKAVKFQKEPQ